MLARRQEVKQGQERGRRIDLMAMNFLKSAAEYLTPVLKTSQFAQKVSVTCLCPALFGAPLSHKGAPPSGAPPTPPPPPSHCRVC